MDAGRNEERVKSRVEGARETLERGRGAEMDTIQALLADRGLSGGGSETEALTGLSEDIAGRFSGDVRDIYTDESQRADDQLVQVLSLAAGLEESDARNAVDWFNAQTGRQRLGQDWDQFAANYGLDSTRLLYDMSSGDMNQLIKILELWFRGAGQSAEGFE
jgi:hypothetical protein